MEHVFGDAFFGIDLNLVALLHLVHLRTPVHSLGLAALVLCQRTGALPDADHLQNRQHHLLLLALLQLPPLLLLPVRQGNEHLLGLALPHYLLNPHLLFLAMPLAGRNREARRGLLPLLLNAFLELNPEADRNVLPLVYLLLRTRHQLLHVPNAPLPQLRLQGLQLGLAKQQLEQLFLRAAVGGCACGVCCESGVAHGVRGFAEFPLLPLGLDLPAESFEFVLLRGKAVTSFSASPSSSLWLCGRSAPRLPFII